MTGESKIILNAITESYLDLRKKYGELGFDGINANSSTLLRLEADMQGALVPNTEKFWHGFMGIRIVERSFMPDGYALLTNGEGVVGIIDINNNRATVVRKSDLLEHRDA